MDYFRFNRLVFDKFSVFAGGTLALVFLAVWSFFEASFWFVAPDLLISIFSILAPKKYRKFIFIVLLSSLLGGIFYYCLNFFYFDQLIRVLYHTPFISERNILFVSEILGKYGVFGAFFQSFTLIPFKIWTSFVFSNGLNPYVYFAIVMISRFIRFFIFALVALYLRKSFERVIRNNFCLLLSLYLVVFFMFMFILEA